MKLLVEKGTTSYICHLFISDTSSTAGAAGLSGLTNASAGLTCYYMRAGATTNVVAALNTITTFGTYAGSATDGAFKQIDATNMPGVYEFHVPDNALVAGAGQVVVLLRGAANMAPQLLEFQLVGNNPSAGLVIKKNQAISAFTFFMASNVDHVSGALGQTITAQRSLDGAPFAACANTSLEVGGGFYRIDLAASDMNGDVVALKFTSTGADPQSVTLVTNA